MIYIFHKKKIISYILASFMVLILFAFSTAMLPNPDAQLVKISSDSTEENNINQDKKDKIMNEIIEK